jgi:hypothetical protein
LAMLFPRLCIFYLPQLRNRHCDRAGGVGVVSSGYGHESRLGPEPAL